MTENLTEILQRLRLTQSAFTGKRMVITGAGSGIGRALAQLAAEAGAQVALAEISDQGAVVEAEIRQTGGQATFLRTDVSDAQSVTALAEAVRRSLGGVDILVNNAIFCPVAAVTEMSVETWDRVMAVNLRGAFLTCHSFLPGMLERGSGLIVNMISTDAMAFMSAYIASKQGLAAFSRSLDAEVSGQGVQVIAFAPGFVDTPGLRSAADTLAPHMGLTAQAFLDLPFHASDTAVKVYGGAMPPLHAAAAVLPLMGGLADEYHGQSIDGYQILERVGFWYDESGASTGMENPHEAVAAEAAAAETAVAEAAVAETAVAEGTTPLAPALDPAEWMKLLDELGRTLEQTAEEFERLPFFVRPMARGGFQSKTGASIERWKKLVENWQAALNQAGPALDGAATAERLDRLAAYYREVPQNTARFSQDAAFLQEVEAISKQRLALIARLKQALHRAA